MSNSNNYCALCQRPLTASDNYLMLSDGALICDKCCDAHHIDAFTFWGNPNKVAGPWASEHNLEDFKRLIRAHSTVTKDIFASQLIETQLEMQIASANHHMSQLPFKKYRSLANDLDIDSGEYIKYITDAYLQGIADSDNLGYLVITNTRILFLKDNSHMKILRSYPLHYVKTVKRQHSWLRNKLTIKIHLHRDMTINLYDDSASRKIVKMLKHHLKESSGMSYTNDKDQVIEADDPADAGMSSDVQHIKLPNDKTTLDTLAPKIAPKRNTCANDGTMIHVATQKPNKPVHRVNHKKWGNNTPVDPADEIRKFKQLADDGIITEDEFKQKKKQLLGLH